MKLKELATIRSYGEYSSENYGAHSLKVSLPEIEIYFSYETPVAFWFAGRLTVCRNDWGVTTGKHLNWINPDHSTRIPQDEFTAKLSVALEKVGYKL